MTNRRVKPTPFEQWLASKSPGSIAVPAPSISDCATPSMGRPRISEARLAELANEILSAAIRMAALLDIAQRPQTRTPRRVARGFLAAEGLGNE